MRSSTLIGRLTADLLMRAGAIVDPGPGRALDVMAGPELRGTLALGEFERLSFEPGVAGSTFIDYDAPLVDRLSAVVNGLGRVARVRPPAAARKLIDAAAMIDRGVTIHNGVHRYHSHVAVDATYVGTAFEYTVLADERMGGVVTTWVNPATRSTASFDSRIDATSLLDDLEAAEASERANGSAAVWPLAVASARARIAPEIPTFSGGCGGAAIAICAGCANTTKRSISRSGASSRALGWTTICAGASAIVSTPRTARFTCAVRRWPIAIASVSVSRRLASGCVVCPRITST